MKSTTDENMSFDIDHRDGESDVRNKDPKVFNLVMYSKNLENFLFFY